MHLNLSLSVAGLPIGLVVGLAGTGGGAPLTPPPVPDPAAR